MTEWSRTFLGDDPWLTGSLPLNPKLEEGSPPRRFQYPPGYNIQIQPRSTEGISFSQLRGLSEYTLVRIIIEHLKDALKAHEWDIISEDRSAGQAHEADIKTAKEFFECPDRRNSWDEWLGMLLEEVLSIDALSIFRHRSRDGRLWALEIIDGGTVKVLTDDRGFEPMPEEDQGEEPPAYQQFLYGVPYINMTRSELIYRPRNRRANKFYGFGPVEQTIVTVNQGFRREFYNLAQFTDGNIPAAYGNVPSDWKPEEIRQWQEYWDALLAGDLQNRSRVRWIPGGQGVGITKMHDEEVFGLHNKFDEWLARIACFSFGVSPMPFITMTNRSVAEEMGDIEAEGGVAVLKQFVERLVNDVIDNDLQMPHLQFNWVTDRARLQAKRIQANIEYLKVGAKSIDEIREENGDKPWGVPPGIITSAGLIPLPIGGFENQPMPEQEIPATPPAEAHGEHEDHVEPDPGKVRHAFSKAREMELSQWERWALARIEKGAHAGKFKCEFIGNEEATLVRGELAKVKFPDEIRHIFSRRRKAVPPMRLRPPEARDAAHRVGDLKTQLRAILGREAERVTRG